MKRLTLLLFILPLASFCQEVIVTPDDYLDSRVKISEIRMIEFLQVRDSISNFASIYPRDGFDNNFSIGLIHQYQSSERELKYRIRIILLDGSELTKTITVDFTNGIFQTNDYYDAVYSPTLPAWDEYDGMIISQG